MDPCRYRVVTVGLDIISKVTRNVPRLRLECCPHRGPKWAWAKAGQLRPWWMEDSRPLPRSSDIRYIPAISTPGRCARALLAMVNPHFYHSGGARPDQILAHLGYGWNSCQ